MRDLIVDLNNRGAVKAIQRGLNVEVDGHWGPITQRAWDAHTAQPLRPHRFNEYLVGVEKMLKCALNAVMEGGR